jgi:predicted O-methyltransferase YrrM
MRSIGLHKFMSMFGYDYHKDEEYVRKLCGMTKCRTRQGENIGFESCFLFLALSQYMKPRSFMEIGTGRGTTSFLMAQRLWMEHVITMDIVDFNTVRDTWFDYQAVQMSNSQIHDKLVERLGGTNCPIARFTGDSRDFCGMSRDGYDLIYIDGCHDYDVVKHDIGLALENSKADNIIILDDYHPNYGVVHAVNEMIPPNEMLLIQVNGHIFGPSEEAGSGHIVWARGAYKEILNEAL